VRTAELDCAAAYDCDTATDATDDELATIELALLSDSAFALLSEVALAFLMDSFLACAFFFATQLLESFLALSDLACEFPHAASDRVVISAIPIVKPFFILNFPKNFSFLRRQYLDL